MLQDIAIQAAKITAAVETVKTAIPKFKSKVESIWTSFTSKVELIWKTVKTAIETAWNSFFVALCFRTETQEDIDDYIDSISDIPLSGNNRGAKKIGLNIGLAYVDKRKYGFDGDCPGCDRDAINMNRLLVKNGFSTKLLLNSEATWESVKGEFEKAASELQEGDLFVVTAAGHGGQVKDVNGDEADGLDETWLLYDREVIDDEIFELLMKFKKNVKIVLINDQCHSEGSFRSIVRSLQRAISFGTWGKFEGKPLVTDSNSKHSESVLNKSENGPMIIQFAGCRESRVSYGSNNGGEWTCALIKTFDRCKTWREWFDSATQIPKKQTPTWVEYGNVSDSFRFGLALK